MKKYFLSLMILLVSTAAIAQVEPEEPDMRVEQSFDGLHVELNQELKDAYILIINDRGRTVSREKMEERFNFIKLKKRANRANRIYTVVLMSSELALRKDVLLTERLR